MEDFTNKIKTINDHLDRESRLYKVVIADIVTNLAISGFFGLENWKEILEASFNTSISALHTSKIIELSLANENNDFSQVLNDVAKGFKKSGFFSKANWNQILTTSFTNAQVDDINIHNEVEMEVCSSEGNAQCNENTTEKRFCCNICRKQFNNKRGIQRHTIRRHTGKRRLHHSVSNQQLSVISPGTALNTNGSSIKTVRLSLENIQRVEYSMHPIERLMKCDESMYHFFCLLNCIGQRQRIAVKKMRLNAEKHCPFDCVLGLGNSIEKIISIIEMNSDNLKKIIVDDQEEELPRKVVIDECNILYLLNKLINQRYGCEDETCEADDHGLLLMSLNILNSI